MRALLHGLLALAALGWQQSEAAGPSKPKSKPKPQPPTPPADDLLATRCQEDIAKLCAGSQRFGQMYVYLCLEEKHDSLSAACRSYLGSTTVGGCNDEAQSLCSQFTDVTDIVNCLETNKPKLSHACIANLNNTRTNPWLEVQERSKHTTRAITAMSMAYLLIPIAVAIWATCKLYALYKLQRRIRLEALDVSKNTKGEEGAIASGWGGGADEHEGENPTVVSVEPPHAHIAFADLSYWAPSSGPLKDQILQKVTGEFKPGSVVAIMGPSGSGKTTLLKLLGGQLNDGRFTGKRLINGRRLDGTKYDRLMRNQAFVHQEDTLLESLTVWATLVYAALLRMPHESSLERQLARAAFLMGELGLSSSWDSLARSLSGGQRRRLSIAVELLGCPAAMFCDEVTSGLDATSSLRVVRTLQKLSRVEKVAVIMTIHQPRAEIFQLFDSLLLLGVGGKLIYSGPTAGASEFLASCPSVGLSLSAYDNHGDFIIDVLGLGPAEISTESASDDEARTAAPSDGDATASGATTDGAEVEMVVFSPLRPRPDPDPSHPGDPSIQVEQLSRAFLNSTVYRDLKFSVDGLHSSDDSTPTEAEISVFQSAPGGVQNSWAHRALDFLLTTSRQIHRSRRRSRSASSVRYSPVFSSAPASEHSASDAGGDNEESSPLPPLRKQVPFIKALWVLFGRRLQAHAPSRTEVGLYLGQMIFTTTVVAVAFSYEVDSDIEKPYQILMLLFMVGTYAMILQYLVLIPEYLAERQVLFAERSSGVVSFGPYILSAMLAEIPRAAVQSGFLITIVYRIHPLNPNFINKLFCVVCLTVGVCAWQSLICVCVVLTDSISVAYSLSFICLGCGGLFGGILVRLSKIPPIFRWLYYTSVTAVTQRALVVNDMQCCYLSATCNSIAQSLAASSAPGGPRGGEPDPNVDDAMGPPRPPEDSSGGGFQAFFQSHQQITVANETVPLTNFCPPGLQVTGDGSDSGNLGRLYLKVLGLEEDNPFTALFFLFLANLLYRALAVIILRLREWRRYKLIDGR